MDPLAQELNGTIIKHNSAVYDLLSEKGREIFFPKKGILGQAAEARGKKINATIGEALSDDGSHMCLKSVKEGLNIPPELAFPYAPSFGRPDVRAKWKEMIYEKNKTLEKKEISLPVVVNALTHGLFVAGYLFLDEKDKVIIPDFFWDNYELIFRNNFGACLEKFNFFANNSIDIISLKLKLKLNTSPVGKKALLLNFPNNPTGYTPAETEMQNVVAAIKEAAEAGNKIVVIIDDAYFGLVYEDGVARESIFSRLADLHENVLAIKLDGPTKEDYVWGLRVGFVTYGVKNGSAELYAALEAKTAGVVRGSISSASNLSQSLLLRAFNSPDYQKEKKEKYEILKKRYEKVKDVLKNENYKKEFRPLPFNSGYFMCVELLNGIEPEKVRKKLLEKYDTGVIVIGSVIRIAFSAVPEKSIPEIFENIYQACLEMKR